MITYTEHDGGRAAAGFKGKTGDCVTRALTLVTTGGNPTGEDYRRIYNAVAELNVTGKKSRAHAERKGRRPVRSNRAGAYLVGDGDDLTISLGLERVPVERGPRPTFTEAHQRYGDCIVKTAKHVVAIVNGALMDTWDSRETWEYDNGRPTGGRVERKAFSIWRLARPRRTAAEEWKAAFAQVSS